MSTLTYCMAVFGSIHLVADIAVIGFLAWFTYESRSTARMIDQMEDRDDDDGDM